MRGKNLLRIALILMICTPLVFVGLILAQPRPIGQTVQNNPFDSNPTAHAESGISVMSPTNAYDGTLITTAYFYYGDADGYFELSGFNNAPPTLFGISWVDMKISYMAEGRPTSDERYRILYYVDPYPDPIVLQDWVSGEDAIYAPETNDKGNRAWGNVTEPNDGVWDWTDIGNVRIVIETDQIVSSNLVNMYIYEVWLTIYTGPPPPPGISVLPLPVLNVPANEIFFVEVYVSNVTKLWGFQFMLYFDPGMLLGFSFFSYGPFTSPAGSEIKPDYVSMASSSYFGDPEGLTGSGPLARIYFRVLGDGASVLDLEDVVLADVYADPIEVDVTDGLFANTYTRDVAVTQVEVSPTQVMPGENVTIDVAVVNQGNWNETFDVTVLYDATHIVPTSTQTVTNLMPGIREDLSFIWNTTAVVTLGHYNITAKASTVPDETDTTNNVKVWDLVPEGVLIGRHDIAVTQIVRAYSNGTVVPDDETLQVLRGETVIINATVSNIGNFTETFNVTARWWEDAYYIENKTNVSVDAGNSKTLTFEWNTDVTYPPWDFGHETVWPFDPLNFSSGEITIYAAPGWKSDGTLFVKGVPHEKLVLDPPYEALGYDYTDDNVFTDGVVNVTRDVRYPIAKFTVDSTEKFVGEPAKFQGGTSQTPEGTTINNYRWDFGDGNVTEGNYPTIWHAYTSTGQYSVNLTVTNSIGLNDSVKTGMTNAPPGEIEVDWRNVKIIGVVASPTSVLVGQNVTISVTIQNEGVKDETKFFVLKTNVTVYYGDVTIGKILAPNLGAWNQPNNQSTVELNWTTSDKSPGIYTIKAVLDVLPYENNTDDNIMLFDGEVTLLWHNIAVSDVSASPTEVTAGESVSIEVTVENQGDFAETFTVTAFANETQIGDPQTVTDLAAGADTTLTFTWETTGVSLGTYTIEAVASTVPGETDTADNTRSGGTVKVVPASSILLYVVAGTAIAIATAIVLLYFFKFRKPKKI